MKKLLAISALALASCGAVPKNEVPPTPEHEQRRREQQREVANEVLILSLRILTRII